MQQLISIPPSKHAGARVVAARTTFRKRVLIMFSDNQKREMIKTDKTGANERVMDEVDIYGDFSRDKTGTEVLGLII